jgi:hypothetical protein
MASEYVLLPIDQITVELPRKRERSDFSELQQSVQRSGLLNPITVRADDSGWILVCGYHRLLSCKSLGWSAIPALVKDYDPLDAELAEIDENLQHHSLTILEQGEHLVRRSEILRQMGLRAERGNNQHTEVGPANVAGPPMTTKAIAEQVGLGERTARMRVEIVMRLPREIRDAIRSTGVANSQTDLLTLGRLDTEEQERVAEAIHEGKARSVSEARRKLNGNGPDEPDDEDENFDPAALDVSDHLRMIACTVTFRYQAPNPTARRRLIGGEERFYPRESEWREPSFILQCAPTEEAVDDLLRRLTHQSRVAMGEALAAVRALGGDDG